MTYRPINADEKLELVEHLLALPVDLQTGSSGVWLTVTFDTRSPAVEMPPWLRLEFPAGMMIDFGNGYWGLETTDATFSVTMVFRGREGRISVPLDEVVVEVQEDPRRGLRSV
jgi:hypothetical protein